MIYEASVLLSIMKIMVALYKQPELTRTPLTGHRCLTACKLAGDSSRARLDKAVDNKGYQSVPSAVPDELGVCKGAKPKRGPSCYEIGCVPDKPDWPLLLSTDGLAAFKRSPRREDHITCNL